MKKIGIITFHRSYNYGSMLQAYALQQILKENGHDNEIIDFALPIQENHYNSNPWNSKYWYKKIIKLLYYLPYANSLKNKKKLFQSFLSENLSLSSKRYYKNSELNDLKYDAIITGSDQIWNPECFEFDWSYYCDFRFSGKRLSYAASMGPGEWDNIEETRKKLKDCLSKYQSILVRESGTKQKIKDLTGLESKVVLDPTILLSKEKWIELIGKEPLIKGDYILFYSPFYREKPFDIVEGIGGKSNIPIISTLSYNYGHDRKYNNLKKYWDCGPKEFLNLCLHARYIIGYSFHMVAFSIIFQKPFWIVDGVKDNRISQLLKIAKLEERSLSSIQDFEEKKRSEKPIDFENVYTLLDPYIQDSKSLLLNSIIQ